MVFYAFTGTLTDVNGEMDWFTPGLSVGTFFSGTMALEPGTPMTTATLHITTGSHLVEARSVGMDTLQAFADHVPTGPLSSPTVQHGYIDNVFFEIAVNGASLGTTGFTVQGPGPTGSSKAVAATGSIQSITVVP